MLKDKENVIKEVKLRLRRYKHVNSKKVAIKDKNKTREIYILNLYDRIAQQCVYQILQPIVENNMSKHSYGYRKGVSVKVPVSKLCTIVLRQTLPPCSLTVDFRDCFTKIHLEKAINELISLGIKDKLFLKTIKHLMWISKEYDGVGLAQGTILAPFLSNCYMNIVDRFVEKEFETLSRKTQFNSSYQKHKEHWIEWIEKRGWKTHCRYYRYADDLIFVCRDSREIAMVKEKFEDFVKKNTDLEFKKSSINLSGEINFLGFQLKKTKSISIRMSNERENMKKIKKWKLKSHKELVSFLRWMNGFLRYYDICNNMKSVITRIADRIWWTSIHKKDGLLTKDDGRQIYREKLKSYQGNKRKQIILDPWAIRKNTKISYKHYLTNNWWISEREKLDSIKTYFHEFSSFVWLLYTKQKGMDVVMNNRLDITNMVIHHIVPISSGGTNEIENFVLVNWWTHQLIHGDYEVKSPKLKWYRQRANKKNN